MKCAVAFVLSVLIGSSAWSAPFGVDFQNATPEELKCTELRVPNRYSCDKFPDERWQLGDYAMIYRKDTGICSIAASSQTIHTEPSGEKLRAAVDALKDEIAEIYGEPEKFDGSRAGTQLSNSDQWTAELSEHNREYSYSWSFEDPVEGVRGIFLMALADSRDEGELQLQFNAPGAFECFSGR